MNAGFGIGHMVVQGDLLNLRRSLVHNLKKQDLIPKLLECSIVGWDNACITNIKTKQSW